jgi:hypothetical protein
VLNLHNRTNQNKTGFEPLYFTSVLEGSFVSFEECFEHYRIQANGDLDKLHDIFHQDYMTNDKNKMVNNALRDSLELTELDIFEKSEI